MIVTIEPGVYMPGKFGVRIEDMVLVTARGGEILTPSTKAPKGDHDISASRAEILEISGMPAADFDAAADMAMALFREGQRLCAERGLILVDTKYEFGKTADGPEYDWYAERYLLHVHEGMSENPEAFLEYLLPVLGRIAGA